MSQLEAAARLLHEGESGKAYQLLEPLVQTHPEVPQARHLFGLAMQMRGDFAGAEKQFRRGLRLTRASIGLNVALAELLVRCDRTDEAEEAFVAALKLDPDCTPALLGLSELHMAADRPARALDVTASLVLRAPAHAVMEAHAGALKALGRLPEALALQTSAVGAFPDSGIAEHNVAATFVEMGRFKEAESGVKRAFSKKTQAPETWVVYGQALEGQQRFQDAEVAFREAIRCRPLYVEAHRRLSQLVWMRTGDADQALATLNTAIADQPRNAQLLDLKSTVLKYAGRVDEALELLQAATAADPTSRVLGVAASHMSLLKGRVDDAIRYARLAVKANPTDRSALLRLCEACLAAGQSVEVDRLADQLFAISPNDQQALAYRATAWRQMEDARYRPLSRYDDLVRSWTLDVPQGWSTLEAYLVDLAAALDGLHPFVAHPLNQTLRHGSQTSHLNASGDPVVRAFFEAADGPIRRHLSVLGTGPDPVRSRNLGSYRFEGVWSVRLWRGGFHTDHVHPKGWLSSACYIVLPKKLHGEPEHSGWLKFGEPGLPTTPRLKAEHFVEPTPGQLVLFPSYMWHGTLPVAGEGSRLTIAFDLLPQAS